MLSNLVGNHLMIYVSQIITLYTLNLHSVVCQSHLNKTGRKKKQQLQPKKKKVFFYSEPC